MKSEVKKIDSTKRQLAIEVGEQTVKQKFDDVFKKIAQEAKIPGFRPGTAPKDIIEKNFSAQAHQMVLKELVPEIYDKAIEKEGLQAVDLPEITDVKLERNSLSFKATVEVSPEIKLKNYKGLKVSHKKIEVEPEEVKRHIDALKEMRTLEKVDDHLAHSLGFATMQELEDAIKRQIYTQKENAQRQKIENEIIESITKDLDFKLPEAVVQRQLHELLRQAKLDLALKGVSREKIDEREKELLKELLPRAQEQVKVYLILSEIAKRENIKSDDTMPRTVIEFLLREANWQ